MSMTMYLAIVCGIVHAIFMSWCQYTLDHQTIFMTYKPGHYNTCGNGSTIDIGESIAEMENIKTFFSRIELKNVKRASILVACLVLFLFHMFDAITNCNKNTANLLSFITSYNFKDCQNSKNDVASRNLIPLEEFENEIETAILEPTLDLGQKSPKTQYKCQTILSVATKTFLSFLGLFFIIVLCCMPLFFYLLENENKVAGRFHLL